MDRSEEISERSQNAADILIVDGNRIDAERTRMELRRAGVSNSFRLVGDMRALRKALQACAPDVVISELDSPGLDGHAVYRVVRDLSRDVPLIFFSNVSYEDAAFASGPSAAIDYVPKSNPSRLPDAVEAAVREAHERRGLRRSLRTVSVRSREAGERLESIWRVVNDPATLGNELSSVLNEAVARIGRGLPYFGLLGHIDASEFVIDVVCGSLGPEGGPARRLIRVGGRGNASAFMHVRDVGAGRTASWDDIEAFPNPPRYSRDAGLRSQITTQFIACGTTYIMTIGSLESPSQTPFCADDYAYVEVVGSILARQLEKQRHDDSVLSAQMHSRRQAERLEALWRIFNSTNLRGDDFIGALLREGSAAMRPQQRFTGTLGHVDGDDFVMDAYAGEPDPADGPARELLPVGFRGKLSESLMGRDLTGPRTKSWTDCLALPDLPERTRQAGIRAQITTQFTAQGKLYLLSLASRETQAVPFSWDDHEYIEVLASMFARQLELEAAESSIRDAEARTRQHAVRLDALWRVVNDQSLRGRAFIQALLDQGAAAIRSGPGWRSVLRHKDGADFVIDASSAPGVWIEHVSIPPGAGTRRTRTWQAGGRSVIATNFEAGGRAYELILGSLEALDGDFVPQDDEYVEVLASVMARQLDLEKMEGSLDQAEILGRHHAQRLEALWRVVNSPALRREEAIVAMLDQGAAAIRPAQAFRGFLSRFEAEEIVVVAVGTNPVVQIGTRLRLKDTIMPLAGRTQGWHDLTELAAIPVGLLMIGWRAIIVTTFDAGGSRYALTFGSSEPTAPFGPEDVGYLEVVASSFASRLQVDMLEDSLRDSDERSKEHAERLEALWQVVNNSNLGSEELILAMLRQAGAAIRPGQEFEAILARVEGEDVVVEAVAGPPKAPGEEELSRVGTVVPLSGTSLGRVIAEGGGTRFWDDLETSTYSSDATRLRGTRSMVITTFRAGSSTWALAFTSTRTMRSPSTAQDHAYIEVLASFFANHLQQRWQSERILYQQSYDVLTGLLNRSAFRSQARQAARTCERYAIIMVDVDSMHEVNESHSHTFGDAVLVEVGNALKKRAQNDEIVGRFGGDVFGIFIPDPPSADHVLARALDFSEAFAHPFSTGDRGGADFVSRTACIGVASAPEDGSQVETIISRSETALFTAQERGYGSTVAYAAGMEAEAQRRATLHTELREAIVSDQFTLYFQPHVEIKTGRVTGCEALIRWNHPVRGLLLPSHFIPFAEETGLIASIDAWVMNNAFSAAQELGRLWKSFRLYFNLSGRQAGDQRVVRAFTDAARCGLALENIGVEITESDAMRDVVATRHVCRALRRLNVRIAIDDFGTGYSSLSSLKRLPIDLVKIDRTFVSGVLTDPHDETITETIISIAEHFGFETLAEGAEQAEELAWLSARGCRYVQGYVISRPLPFQDFKTWLIERDIA
jgi:diguanylate cyclase (GGDEF)-like protein